MNFHTDSTIQGSRGSTGMHKLLTRSLPLPTPTTPQRFPVLDTRDATMPDLYALDNQTRALLLGPFSAVLAAAEAATNGRGTFDPLIRLWTALLNIGPGPLYDVRAAAGARAHGTTGGGAQRRRRRALGRAHGSRLKFLDCVPILWLPACWDGRGLACSAIGCQPAGSLATLHRVSPSPRPSHQTTALYVLRNLSPTVRARRPAPMTVARCLLLAGRRLLAASRDLDSATSQRRPTHPSTTLPFPLQIMSIFLGQASAWGCNQMAPRARCSGAVPRCAAAARLGPGSQGRMRNPQQCPSRRRPSWFQGFTFTGGCQALYGKIAAYLGDAVKLDATFKIARPPARAPAGARASVRYSAGGGKATKASCKKVVVSALQTVDNLKSFTSLDAQETAAFKDVSATRCGCGTRGCRRACSPLQRTLGPRTDHQGAFLPPTPGPCVPQVVTTALGVTFVKTQPAPAYANIIIDAKIEGLVSSDFPTTVSAWVIGPLGGITQVLSLPLSRARARAHTHTHTHNRQTDRRTDRAMHTRTHARTQHVDAHTAAPCARSGDTRPPPSLSWAPLHQAHTCKPSGPDAPGDILSRVCTNMTAWATSTGGAYFSAPACGSGAAGPWVLYGPRIHDYTPRAANPADTPAFYKRIYALQVRLLWRCEFACRLAPICLLAVSGAAWSFLAPTHRRPQLGPALPPSHANPSASPQGYRSTYHVGALLSLNSQADVWAHAKSVVDGMSWA
jgi:hypothetical protein